MGQRRHTVGGGEISSVGSYEGACRKARTGGIFQRVHRRLYRRRGREREIEKERDPISMSERGGFGSRCWRGKGGRRAGDGGRERDGDRGGEKEKKYGGGGCTATRPPSPSVSHPIVNSKAVLDPSPCVLVRESCFTRCFWLLYSARGC